MIKLKSKTHSFGVLLALAGGLLQFLPTAREFISPDMYGSIFIGVSVIVILLRNVTTTPISQK